MDKNKYYIPEISEFYVGFEYQFRTIVYDWATVEYEILDFKHLLNNLKDKLIRIKYLDKEDIDKCQKLLKPNHIIHSYENDLCQIIIIDTNHTYPMTIPNTNFREHPVIFQGYIKNISELKRLIKQLNYDQTR